MVRTFKPTKRAVQYQKPAQPLVIQGLSAEGRGIARHQGRTVFVRGALPGERVTIKAWQSRARFDECVVDRVIEAATERVLPSCPHYNECGGCQLMHLNASAQLQAKIHQLQQDLQRALGHANWESLSSITSDESSRSRASMFITPQGLAGYRIQGSQNGVVIHTCQQWVRPLQEALPQLQSALSAVPDAVKRLVSLAWCEAEEGIAIVFFYKRSMPITQRESLCQQLPTDWWVGFCEQQQRQLTDAAGQPVDDVRLTFHVTDDLPIRFHPLDFTQVNRQVNRAMVAQTIAWLKQSNSSKVLDLFCGIGNFSLPLAHEGFDVVGVEAEASMVARAVENAQRMGLSATFLARDLFDAAEVASLADYGADAIVIDPPRAGAKFLCESFRRLEARHCIYISCNPATFTRDAQALEKQGFQLTALRCLDMFPNTAHLELMAYFVNADV